MNPLVPYFSFFLFIVTLLQPLITCQLLCRGWHVNGNAHVTIQDVYVRSRDGFVGEDLFAYLCCFNYKMKVQKSVFGF